MPAVPQNKREYVSLYDLLEASQLSEAISKMHKILLEKGDHPIYISGDDVDVQVYVNRLETQEEAELREENARLAQERQANYEREQYQRLKAKFEPKA